MTKDVFGIVGTVVGGAYEVQDVVAEGGFGVVYRAFHSGFRADVALKCLKVPQGLDASNQELFLDQFRSEAELLFRLSASIPTVVRPLNVDAMTVPDGRFVPFIALEWLEGENLEAVMYRRAADGRSPFTLKKLVRLLTPVARALERAHNFTGDSGPVSIVHRDMKPENIFLANVAGEDVVKILDFGIGKAKSVASQVAGRQSQRGGGVASFTPAYGAPEQWLPKRYGQTGPWTDVWGLALTMVEVMSVRPIIDGDHAEMMGTCIDAERRPTPRTEGIEVSDEVEAVFVRAVAVDPRDRYADVGLFWNELCSVLGMDDNATGRRRDARAEGFTAPRAEVVDLEPRRRPSQVPPQGRLAPAIAPRSRSGQMAAVGQPRPATSGQEVPISVRGSGASGQHAAVRGSGTSGQHAAVRGSGASGQHAAVRGSGASGQHAAVSQPGPAPQIPDLAVGPTSNREPPPASVRGAVQQSVGSPPAPAPAATAAAPAVAAIPAGPGLDLDLAPGERPVARSSSSGAAWPAVGSATSRSGSWQRPPGATGTSSARLPAVSGLSGGSTDPKTEVGRLSGGRGARRPMAKSTKVGLPRLLVIPVILVVLGIGLSVAQGMYAARTGQIATFGPLKLSWVAGPLVLLGLALGVHRAIKR